MSDALDKVRDVRTLPIFPLPVILLPGEIIPLHIFEPPYRTTLTDIQAGNQLSGLSYYEGTETESRKPPLGHLGCVAEVREVQEMPDGRSNIVISGVIRYMVDEYPDSDEPYFVGEVSFFEDEPDENEEKLSELSKEVTEYFNRMGQADTRRRSVRKRYPD